MYFSTSLQALGKPLPVLVPENETTKQSMTACENSVRYSASVARKHAHGDLAIHLRSLINQAGTSDLEIICKDKVRVRACRIFLIGRSPVLTKMLTNGMLETTSSIIHLPGICSTSLLSILEFLYTGDILHYLPKDWRAGLEIMSAAHYFWLSDVDRIVQDYLVKEIASAATNFQQIAIMLTTAMTFKNLCHDYDIILLQLVSLLGLKWADTNVARCLSEEALNFILRRSKPIVKQEDLLASSLDEYFRFRGVMLWSVCNSHLVSLKGEVKQLATEAIPPVEAANEVVNGPTSVEATKLKSEVTPFLETTALESGAASPLQANGLVKEVMSPVEAMKLVNGAIPLAKKELYIKGASDLSTTDVTWLPKYKETSTQGEMIQFFISHQATKEAAVRLLMHIDWTQMPVPLFIKVVEPLKLIPDSKLVDIFRFHSLHRTMRVKLIWIVHGQTYTVQNDGFIIQKAKQGCGSAMCQLENRLDEEVCVWRFTIQEFGPEVQIGFLCSETMEAAGRVWSFKDNCSTALTMLGSLGSFMCKLILCVDASRAGFSQSQYGRLDGIDPLKVTTSQRVEFRYHRTKRSCSITVDNKDLGTMWSNISGRIVQPVVSFGDSDKGRVRIDIVSGFEIL